jgi:hypothetical protein
MFGTSYGPPLSTAIYIEFGDMLTCNAYSSECMNVDSASKLSRGTWSTSQKSDKCWIQ